MTDRIKYQLKSICEGFAGGIIILSYISIFPIYIFECVKNIKYLIISPIMLIWLLMPILALFWDNIFEYEEPYIYKSNIDIRFDLEKENKKLKKIIDKQNKLKYATVL
jgi:hypothetical protein